MCGAPSCLAISAENARETFPGLEVTPSPQPDQADTEAYAKWCEEYKQWGHVQCSCGNGYYCKRHGKWIPGIDVTNNIAPPQDEEHLRDCPPQHYDPQESEQHAYGATTYGQLDTSSTANAYRAAYYGASGDQQALNVDEYDDQLRQYDDTGLGTATHSSSSHRKQRSTSEAQRHGKGKHRDDRSAKSRGSSSKTDKTKSKSQSDRGSTYDIESSSTTLLPEDPNSLSTYDQDFDPRGSAELAYPSTETQGSIDPRYAGSHSYAGGTAYSTTRSQMAAPMPSDSDGARRYPHSESVDPQQDYEYDDDPQYTDDTAKTYGSSSRDHHKQSARHRSSKKREKKPQDSRQHDGPTHYAESSSSAVAPYGMADPHETYGQEMWDTQDNNLMAAKMSGLSVHEEAYPPAADYGPYEYYERDEQSVAGSSTAKTSRSHAGKKHRHKKSR